MPDPTGPTATAEQDILAEFHPAVAAWFRSRFDAPTEPQAATWPLVRAGRNVLVAAPTGSGKTLAAFLTAIDGLIGTPGSAGPGVRVLYVSPLRALDNDVHRNLREPLTGIAEHAARLGLPIRMPTAAVRTGDTPPTERRRQWRHPPDILITTPETLFLLLTSPRAPTLLATVQTVVVDEIHALAGNKRGAHLALSLERLDRLCPRPPQRLGLSATQRPLELVAAFLGGRHPVTIVDAARPRPPELRVSVPVPDFRALPGDSVWDSIAPLVLQDVLAHRTTAIFVPDRARAESLTHRLNALAGAEICRAHHGSLSRQAREATEAALKAGALRAVCATGTLELGIDVGSIDHVVLVGSPGSATRGLQRIGRSRHTVGDTPSGRLVCRTALEVAEAAVLARAMVRGDLEPLRVPSGCLDVLAQHLVSLAASSEWRVTDALDLVRGALPFRHLAEADFLAVLELVSGGRGRSELPGLPPQVVWDRRRGVFFGRPGAARAAAVGVGTIPDRGLFPVYGPDGRQVGELDEEFVHESRRGDVFVLGTTSWRIVAITPERVLVVPGGGGLPRVPFWHGEAVGRPYTVGRALLALFGEAQGRGPEDPWWAELSAQCRLDSDALAVLQRLIRDQAGAGCLPTDRRLPVEWYRDPLGDVRVVVHAPLGRGVTVPWLLALRALLRRELGLVSDGVATDGGILLRLAPRADGEPPLPPPELLRRWPPETLERALREELPGTPLLLARFRECAARALLLPRGGTRRRLPLWLQRLRAADLLEAARRQPDFPILREALRECLEDHFDLPAWREVLAAIAARQLAVVACPRPGPSPFAAELEFWFKAAALYQGDAPRAERAGADLVATGEEPGGTYLARAEAALAARLAGPPVRTAQELQDRLRQLGLMLRAEIPDGRLLTALLAAGAAVEADGSGRVVAAEDLDRWRAAVGGDTQARADFVRRWAATVPAVTPEGIRERFGWEVPDLAVLGLQALPDGRYADPAVRRRIRRRAVALARAEMAPVPRSVFAEFVRRRQQGVDLEDVLGRLQGVFLPLRVWLAEVLPAKVPGFRPEELERLVARGVVLWVGRGSEVAFYRRQDYPHLAPPPAAAGELLPPDAALWFSDLQARTGLGAEDLDLRLRALAAQGAASNDSLEPLYTAPDPRRRAVGGRWWALPPATPQATAWAEQLLARYGVLSRELWERAAPPVPWSAGLEALGALGARRGYFVRGLGGVQYARPADVDRLRETRPAGTCLLAGLDPACTWPEVPRRPGSFLVLVEGLPALQVSGFGRRIRQLRSMDGEALGAAVAALRDLPAPRGRVEVAEWDGVPILASQVAPLFEAAGFSRGPRTLRWRREEAALKAPGTAPDVPPPRPGGPWPPGRAGPSPP